MRIGLIHRINVPCKIQISENAVTVPAPEFEEGWFRTISSESKVTYIQKLKDNLFVENNTIKNAGKNCSSTH